MVVTVLLQTTHSIGRYSNGFLFDRRNFHYSGSKDVLRELSFGNTQAFHDLCPFGVGLEGFECIV